MIYKNKKKSKYLSVLLVVKTGVTEIQSGWAQNEVDRCFPSNKPNLARLIVRDYSCHLFPSSGRFY